MHIFASSAQQPAAVLSPRPGHTLLEHPPVVTLFGNNGGLKGSCTVIDTNVTKTTYGNNECPYGAQMINQ